MHILYILYNNKDFKIRYVGITSKSLENRLYYHLKDAKHKRTHKEKWINKSIKNGFKISIKKIKICKCLNSLKSEEIKLIKYLKSRNYNLTNATSGGDGIFNPTKEVRRKISIATKKQVWTKERRKKLSDFKKGKPSSATGIKWKLESRLKLSNSKKGKPSNHVRPVIEYNLDNKFIKRWNSMTEAATYHNILVTSICNNLKGKSKHCNKSIWKYE